jgi:hypothetical protein
VPPELRTLACPKYPDHGNVRVRWLPVDEREQIANKRVEDIVEIDCPVCGKYECAHRDFSQPEASGSS